MIALCWRIWKQVPQSFKRLSSFHPVTLTPNLKASWTTCRPQETALTKAGNWGSVGAPSAKNSSLKSSKTFSFGVLPIQRHSDEICCVLPCLVPIKTLKQIWGLCMPKKLGLQIPWLDLLYLVNPEPDNELVLKKFLTVFEDMVDLISDLCFFPFSMAEQGLFSHVFKLKCNMANSTEGWEPVPANLLNSRGKFWIFQPVFIKGNFLLATCVQSRRITPKLTAKLVRPSISLIFKLAQDSSYRCQRRQLCNSFNCLCHKKARIFWEVSKQTIKKNF